MPASGYSGSDSFTYKVNDGASDSAAATVSITVYGDPEAQIGSVVGSRSATVPTVSDNELRTIVSAAIGRWAAILTDAALVQKMQHVKVEFDVNHLLPDQWLGGTYTDIGVIKINVTALGMGWYVDQTPFADEEFAGQQATTDLAASSSTASGHYDLLTLVMHEFGHIIGLHDVDSRATHQLMTETIDPSIRRLVANNQLAAVATGQESAAVGLGGSLQVDGVDALFSTQDEDALLYDGHGQAESPVLRSDLSVAVVAGPASGGE